MPTGLPAILQWFEQVGRTKYDPTYLQIGWDLTALQADTSYGLKILLQYANRRQRAPHGFEVAGIKAVAACVRERRPFTEIPNYFRQFYHGSLNLSRNPAMNPRIAT